MNSLRPHLRALWLRHGLICLLALGEAGLAPHHATAAPLPGSVDPSRAQDRLAGPMPVPGNQDQIIPKPDDAPLTAPPHPADGFTLTGVVIEGATAVSAGDLEKTYQDCLGKPTDLETLRFIAARITRLYHDRGYLISRAVVPEQNISDGRAHIAVVEGYVGRVRFDGDVMQTLRNHDRLDVIGKVERAIVAMRPLNGPALERALLLINSLPGVTVHAVLEPLPPEDAAPGAVGMVIQLGLNRTEYSVGIDNFGSRYAGPYEITANATVNSGLLAFDRTSLNLLTTTQTKEVRVGTLDYALPLNAIGTILAARIGYSSLVPGYTLDPLDVHSKSYNASLQIEQNVMRSREGGVTLSAGIDAANITTDLLDTTLYKDKIRALRVGSQFDWTDRFNGSNAGNLTLSQGLDFLGTRRTGSPDLSRADGHSDFTKLAATLTRTQQIGSIWQLYGAVSGQYAWTPLLSSEQFGYGGQAFGRAYDPSEITGNNGVATSLELRYIGLPEWNALFLQPFSFYDFGKVWQTGGAAENISGSSVGAGLKFLYNQHVSGYLAAAIPLTLPASAPPGYANGGSPRYLFQLSTRF